MSGLGFNDANWAYALTGLQQMQKVVLVAVCHRTDDKTHETFVGQQTIATMIGASVSTVMRALNVLEQAGVIERRRRNGAGGYRTSDLIIVNRAYTPESPEGAAPTRQNSYQDDSTNLTVTAPRPTRHSDGAEEINQRDQSKDQSVSCADAFDRAWKQWPKKVNRKAAFVAFTRAARSRSVSELEADVTRFGTAYARTATDAQYVPHLSSWLDGERWTDDIPASRLTRRLDVIATLANMDARDAAGKTIGSCEAGMHRLLDDGTCTRCEYRSPVEVFEDGRPF
ncbi:helix-turn-helix domain-containing protein [Microbacterium binotii]|uniref:helix-turn-helix domain-containing protein n=1 Tax=Microbacterium binotii TaxID=462710 RepID=UPI001F305260|nr:helix-turn-helix domain-containing protein [Microbacterium binotii]UIN31893.1 helix-turn-helix domain-containing protein [Microbacterium binotii]